MENYLFGVKTQHFTGAGWQPLWFWGHLKRFKWKIPVY